MAINFNSLPNSNPGGGLPPKGTYYATVKKAEMKPPKQIPGNPAKPDYLNMQLQLATAEGKSAGSIFDILSESDNDTIRYKIQRFITALGIPIQGNFELKDLVKIIPGKQFIVDITHDERGVKDGYPIKAVVDVFTNSIYYPLSEATKIFGTAQPTGPINAPDGDDVPFPTDADADTDY